MVLCFLSKSNLKNMFSPGQVYKRSFQPRIFQLCSNTLNYLRADSRKDQLFWILYKFYTVVLCSQVNNSVANQRHSFEKYKTGLSIQTNALVWPCKQPSSTSTDLGDPKGKMTTTLHCSCCASISDKTKAQRE